MVLLESRDNLVVLGGWGGEKRDGMNSEGVSKILDHDIDYYLYLLFNS